MAINNIFIIAKQYVYRCKMGKIRPNIEGFKKQMSTYYNVLKLNAQKSASLEKLTNIWNKFVALSANSEQ